MGTKYIEGDLHVKGRLWQNEKEVNVLLIDYTNVNEGGVIITSIADEELEIIKILKDVTGWRLKEAKDFLTSVSVGTDLTTHIYNGFQLTDTQIAEFVAQTTAQNYMTFSLGGSSISPLKTVTIPEGKKSIIFNDTTEILLEGSGIYRHTLTLFERNYQPITVFSTKSTPYTLEELYATPIFINCYTIGGPFHNGGHFYTCYKWFGEGEGIIFESIDCEPISQPIRTDGAAIDTVTKV